MRRCGRRLGMVLMLLALSCVGGAAWSANVSGDRTNVINSDNPIPGGYANGSAGQIAEAGKLGANYIQNNQWYQYELITNIAGTSTYGWVNYNASSDESVAQIRPRQISELMK